MRMNAQLGTINVSRCVVILMVAITVSATKATGLVRTESRVMVRHQKYAEHGRTTLAEANNVLVAISRVDHL